MLHSLDVRLIAHDGTALSFSALGSPILLLVYRDPWCRSCTVQLRELARRERDSAELGMPIALVTLQEPQVNAVLAAKLELPFPILSDPGGERILKPLGLVGGSGRLRPAAVVLDPDGRELVRLERPRDKEHASPVELCDAIRSSTSAAEPLIGTRDAQAPEADV